MTAKRINWTEYHQTRAAILRDTAQEYRRNAQLQLLAGEPQLAEFASHRALQNEVWAVQEDSLAEAAR